ERERRRRRICRNKDVGWLKLRLTLQHDAASVFAMRLAGDLGAEVLEQSLGVVAGCFRLYDGRLARRGKTGKQHSRLELRGSDRRFVNDRDRIGGAADRQWEAPAVGHLQH